MKHTDELLAWMLAAEDHPHLKHEEAYLSAKTQFEASSELQTQFEEALRFSRKHPELFGFAIMPDDVRERIALRLKRDTSAPEPLPSELPSPWSYRQQFAWAAVLALFLAGLSVISSKIIEQQSPDFPERQLARTPPPLQGLPAFHHFVQTSLAESKPHFQHQGADTVQLVRWLEANEGFAPPLPEVITQAKGMGCSVLESQQGKISMICVDVNGQQLKLFIACSKKLGTPPKDVHALRIDRHEALEWTNENNTFLLIQSTPEAPMPEIML